MLNHFGQIPERNKFAKRQCASSDDTPGLPVSFFSPSGDKAEYEAGVSQLMTALVESSYENLKEVLSKYAIDRGDKSPQTDSDVDARQLSASEKTTKKAAFHKRLQSNRSYRTALLTELMWVAECGPLWKVICAYNQMNAESAAAAIISPFREEVRMMLALEEQLVSP